MWITTEGQITLTPFKLIKVDLESQLCWCHVEREDEDFFNLFKSRPEIKCFFPQSGIFIFSHFHSINPQSKIIKFSLPKYAVPKERRKDERFDLSGQLSLTIKDGAFSRKFKVFDISQGGLSIILSKSDHFTITGSEKLKEAIIEPFKLPTSLKLILVLKVRPFVLEKIPYAGKKFSFEFSFKHEKQALKWKELWPKVLQFIE